MKYIELVISDDCKKIMRCESGREEMLVTWLQRQIDSLYNRITESDFRCVVRYYELGYWEYIEFVAYFRALFMLDTFDEANWIYVAKHAMHDKICSLLDERRGVK